MHDAALLGKGRAWSVPGVSLFTWNGLVPERLSSRGLALLGSRWRGWGDGVHERVWARAEDRLYIFTFIKKVLYQTYKYVIIYMWHGVVLKRLKRRPC